MAYYRFRSATSESEVSDIACHPAYEDAIEEWERIRDVIQGERFVKERGTRYLPALFEQESVDYLRYQNRAVFFNATRRTRDGMVGLLLRKTPELEADDSVEKLQGDVDLCGGTLKDYIRTVAEEVSSTGRCGSMIDWSEGEARPYFSFYHAEDVLAWETERREGKMHLVRLVLRECSHRLLSEEASNFTSISTIRTYRLDEDGTVTMEAVEYQDGTAQPAEEAIDMTIKGKKLERIPFVFHTVDGDRPDVAVSPLADMAAINISHYQTSADLENGRHVAGLPTPWAKGFGDDTELILGTSHAWITDETGADCGFLEFTGQGLGALENALKEKQGQMAVLGARMLEAQQGDAESFETVQLRSNAEQATLVNVAEAISATMSKALQFMAWWEGLPTKAPTDYADTNSIVLNTDFVAAKLDSASLTAMIGAYQGGAISWQTFYYNLEQGEMFKEGWTIEDEDAAILQAPASKPDPEPAPAPKPAPKKPEA
tara:strand:- start:19569 stop:21032 length:1464 start_codon:yes stop_codon:yes gene_type:complete